ncbi:MAG: CTP synthase (glutamine hydrolyzing) [Candidatus Heimdallarchaeota archaeon]|nr:CTP synthase (glutamine hydrolyzing) [Candidatus Heimdallarchaeota archaeon]
MPKYIFICGALISGLGKGVVTSSIGKNLQVRGKKVNVIKIDPYLNIDAGTMNPYEHGETYVTADGSEIDVDFGHYERMLNLEMCGDQNITTGQVYQSVIEKERRGDFLGKTVQVIPHITDEIKRRIKLIADREPSYDVLIIEVGGTIGDIESQHFLEAIRQLRREMPQEDSLLVLVTYILEPPNLKEQKTKPIQHAVRDLQAMGLRPDIVVARGSKDLTEKSKDKIVMFCDVPANAVFSLPDLDNVLSAPRYLDKQGFGSTLNLKMRFEDITADWSEEDRLLEKFSNKDRNVHIAIIGKYTELADSYISVKEAIKHAAAHNNVYANIEFISTEDYEENPERIHELNKFDGILVPGGFGSRGAEGKIQVIRYSRENGIPFLGICYGFQLAVIEFARNVCYIKDANTSENSDKVLNPVIDLLPEQKEISDLGGTMRLGKHNIIIEKGTIFEKLYESNLISERHRHRYEVNVEYIDQLKEKGLVFSGRSEDGKRMESLEIENHPCFIATQYHPEFQSRPKQPAPPFSEFLRATVIRSELK